MLDDKQYTDEINNLLPTWIREGRKDLVDPRSVWDWVKYNVKRYSRQYSINKSRQTREQELQLDRDLQDASAAFHHNPSQENLSRLNVLKEKLEQLYEKRVEGIIVRSRARWHEHGERNSKNFFNLGKRNHIRKYIRKLNLSSVITTDPFTILEAEKKFYKNLYRNRRFDSQDGNAFCYETLPIPKLSNESRHLGEGVISLEECTKV